MGHVLKIALVIAALLVTSLAPVSVTAQEPNQDPNQNQNQNQGQVGGVSIDASGANEVYTSDAGQSGQTTISTSPGAMSANTADGQGNREERRAARRAAREAAAADVAPIAAEPVAAEPEPEAAPEPVAEAPAPAAAPVVALPNTGTGVASQGSVALMLLLAGLAAVAAAMTFRRVRAA